MYDKRVNWFPSYPKGCRDGSCSNYSFVCASSMNGNSKDAAECSPHPVGYLSQKPGECGVYLFMLLLVLVGWL